jgi:hypothetical protein
MTTASKTGRELRANIRRGKRPSTGGATERSETRVTSPHSTSLNHAECVARDAVRSVSHPAGRASTNGVPARLRPTLVAAVRSALSPANYSVLQLGATRCGDSARTFSPKVAGSNPARPIQTLHIRASAASWIVEGCRRGRAVFVSTRTGHRRGWAAKAAPECVAAARVRSRRVRDSRIPA